MTSLRVQRWLLLLAVWIASAAYVTPRMRTGWIAFDDGMLAHSAERVLDGELPHRDFDEVYTGGLDYVHAVAFRAFGTSLGSLRLTLLIAFLLWVPAVYYLASRVGSPVGAAGVTLLALGLSIPEYPASMPSWYNLFLATFGTAALFRFISSSRRRWLFVAGLCGGVSILFKVVGLYFVAATILFTVYWEQVTSAADAPPIPRRDRAYSLFVIGALATLVVLLSVLVRPRITVEDLFYFVVPGASVATLLVWRELTLRPSSSLDARRRLAKLTALLAPLLAGVALPVALFLVPYVRTAALDAFLHGVLVAPQARLTFAGRHPPPLYAVVIALPLVLHLGFVPRWRSRMRAGNGGRILLVALLGAVLAASSHVGVFLTVWVSLLTVTPLCVLAGTWMLAKGEMTAPERRRSELFTLTSVVAMCGLVQFPYSDPTYFCYVAPIVVLAIYAFVMAQEPVPRAEGVIVLAFYLLFAVMRVHPTMVWYLSGGYDPRQELAPLDSGRGGGIVMRRSHRDEYARLVTELRRHAGGTGGYLFATPDCPEVYFLSGLRNPTRTIFDFFDDPGGRTTRILGLLQVHDVRVVALNQLPTFSPRIDPALDSALTARYPYAESIGRFVIRWR